MSNKERGGSRILKNGSAEYRRRENEVIEMMKSDKYSSVQITSADGYVAIEKSTMVHKPEEIEAAQILADKGYKVILKDEGSTEGKTPDGYVFSLSYEQRTPTKDRAETIRYALNHARDKGADVAVIYSKHHSFSRITMEAGVNLFEINDPYRFKKIIIVADNGHIHKYRHTK